MWKLVIEDDEGKRTVVPLTRDEYSIGRQEGNTIRLTERNISRAHARLHKRDPVGPGQSTTFALEDLTSYNGVFVNGIRVAEEQELAHGDLVQIGDYRVVIQDERLAEAADTASTEGKQTIPSAPSARAAALLDRPNRLVMIAGPAVGAEFPLDRERLTIGRAEDAGISVNHNSVSRLHCEVHALGDGRFEIIDKGSSNGVRVNGADLRRGIIEPADIIELGDAKFKFVGAGQIFLATEVPPPERSPRDLARRSRGNAVPIAAFLVVVIAGAAGAWTYTRPRVERAPSVALAAASPDRSALDRAKKLSNSGDLEGGHKALAAISNTSALRNSSDFRDVENRWADNLLEHADAESDVAVKRALYQRVAQAMTVEPSRRKTSADKLQELDAVASTAAANRAQVPSTVSASADAGGSQGARIETARRTVALEPAAAPPMFVPPPVPPPPTLPVTTSPRPPGASVDDRERQLSLQGTPDAKILLKQQLEQRVYSGKATDTEIRLLISTCKDLGDKPCVQEARAIQAQRGP